jgi:hypothetical protein
MSDAPVERENRSLTWIHAIRYTANRPPLHAAGHPHFRGQTLLLSFRVSATAQERQGAVVDA